MTKPYVTAQQIELDDDELYIMNCRPAERDRTAMLTMLVIVGGVKHRNARCTNTSLAE